MKISMEGLVNGLQSNRIELEVGLAEVLPLKETTYRVLDVIDVADLSPRG